VRHSEAALPKEDDEEGRAGSGSNEEEEEGVEDKETAFNALLKLRATADAVAEAAVPLVVAELVKDADVDEDAAFEPPVAES
jgi:hypothetical protein